MLTRPMTGLLAKLAAGPRAIADLARRGAGLARGPGEQKKLVTAPWSGTWPAPGATLDLDFANNRGFVRGVGMGGAMDAVTFTRASQGSYVNKTGLLEMMSTNILTFTQDFSNSVWVKASVTASQMNVEDPDGGYTASTITATSNNGYFYYNTNQNPVSVTVTSSLWIRRRTGTGTISLRTNAGSFTDTPITVTSSWTRVSVQCLSGSNVNNCWVLKLDTSGDAVDIWHPQLEIGSTLTPYSVPNINTPRFDWASTATVAQVNLYRQTEAFNSAYWITGNASITSDASTAPNGTTTADKLVENTANNFHGFRGEAFFAGTYTLSIYAKAAERSKILVGTYNGSTVSTGFDLLSGTTFTITGATVPTSSSISSVGSGWYRCSVTFTVTSSDSGFFCSLTSSSLAYTGDGTSGLLIWGAQLESGASLTAYQAVAQPTTNTPLAAASTCNGLLIEESRTNRILWCRDATQSNWTKTNVTTAKDQTGIDGVANAASSLTATSASGTCIQTITLASGSRTGSVYLKRITGTGNVQVSLDGSTWSTVDLSSTEWRRIVLSGTVTNPVVGIRIATNGDAVAMDYAQVEDGAFATTPILTTSATATRAVDTCGMSLANFGTNGNRYNKGTLFSVFVPNFSGTQTNGSACGVFLRDMSNPSNNNIRATNNGNAVASCGVSAPGSISSLNLSSYTQAELKFAVSFSGGTINGAIAGESFSGGRAAAIIGGGRDPQTGSVSFGGTSQPLLNSLTFNNEVYTMYVKRVIFNDQFMTTDALRSIVS